MFQVSIVFITFVFMEFVAWATHKYVMHGFLWYLHEDHHVPSPCDKAWHTVNAIVISMNSNLKASSKLPQPTQINETILGKNFGPA